MTAATPTTTITIPKAAAADLAALVDRYPEQIAPEHRVALLVVLRGAALLGKS